MLKSSNKQDEGRTSLSTIVDGTEDMEASAVPTEDTKASAVPNKFLEELCKNEQFKYRQASLEALESEKDEE